MIIKQQHRRRIAGFTASPNPTLISATIEDAAPTDIVMVFSEVVTGTNLGFTIGGTTSTTFSSISGSGTDTITGVLGTAATDAETVLLSYNDAVGDIVNGTSDILESFSNTAVTNNIIGVDIFSGAGAIYSLRKFFSWSNAVIKIRRSSDDTTAFLFFDGSSSSNLITTSGFISLTSNTTPDTGPNVTLATWIGSNDGFVVDWFAQTPDGNIDSDLVMQGSLTVDFPQIVASGVIVTENSLPAIDLDGSNHFVLNGTHIPALGSLGGDQANTVFTVSTNDLTTTNGAIFSATSLSTRKYIHFNSRNVNKTTILIKTSIAQYIVVTTATQDHANQKILTSTIDGSRLCTLYYNGTSQNNLTFVNSYENAKATIGSQQGSSSRINGRIQEVIIFPTDKTSDLTDLHNDINTYYSIF